MKPQTTLHDLFEQLGQYSPQLLRATPAYYLQPDSVGEVYGLSPLEIPVLLVQTLDEGTREVVLPEGTPALRVQATDFRKPFEEPEPLMALPEQYRVTPASLRSGGKHQALRGTRAQLYAWEQGEQPNGGMFILPREGSPNGQFFLTLADTGLGNDRTTPTRWEHVSVSLLHSAREKRCPTWEEMCRVKDLFWPQQACVVQYHPPGDQYVNYHPYVLHLWRSLVLNPMQPPPNLVGPVGQGRGQ